MLIAGCVAEMPSRAFAQQMGQSAMAPAGGVVNRAVAGLQDLNANGPGLFYYGINAADQGLGYNGSYMTFGGFIPYSEDDLGGFWSADIRSHLSGYGGFFSNVGFVRKQFIGGAIGGIGVYWDYDGDQNQYPLKGSCGTGQLGQFGHTYNQVGISGEFLTDFGNLRSNGYIPVGTTSYTAGAIGSSFYQNYAMCQYGLDAALAGADLEVGAYIPGLSDWAGMVSVGGYAYGNTQSQWSHGTQANQAVVPYFGGVYTRLDMTFLENWDFSLQYNNDSVFDSTGFARLTYRMGGSRRRNVPDQMEQPMMRNEHIVRDHKTPEFAINPATGAPWRVVHINNTAAAGGNGSVERPYNTILAADTPTSAGGVAGAPETIFLVNPGNGTATGYDTMFSPLAANQYFVGDGLPFVLPTTCCGLLDIATLSTGTPLLTNPTGASIEIKNGLVVNNFNIQNSAIGILGTGNLSSGIARGGLPPPYNSLTGVSVVNNVTISGTGTPNQKGIFIDNATGGADFRAVSISGMTAGAVVVDSGDPTIDFREGSITNSADNILHVNATSGGSVTLVSKPGVPFVDTGDGILVENADGDVAVSGANITSKKDGINVVNSSGVQTFNDVQILAAGTNGGSGYAGVNLENNGGTSNFNNLTISLTDPTNTATGFLASNDNVIDVTGNSSVTVTGAPAVSMTNVADANINFKTVTSTGSPSNGVLLDTVAGTFNVASSLTVTDSQGDGLVIKNSPNLIFSSPVTNVSTATGAAADGIVLQNNSVDATKVNLGQVTVATTNGTGLIVQDAGVTTAGGTINATGGASIATNNADVNITLASATSTNSSGPGCRPQISRPPSSTAAVGDPGTPNVSIGSKAAVPAAWAAVSGATTPSTCPVPNFAPSLEKRLATP